jgi:hypothetical protein
MEGERKGGREGGRKGEREGGTEGGEDEHVAHLRPHLEAGPTMA